jgi:hypothetical protein
MNKIGISLGMKCDSAVWGVENNIRSTKANGYKTCPFDEIISNLPGIIQCLRDDFKYFLTDLRVLPNGEGVMDHYGLWFTHDWPTTQQPNIDALNVDYISNHALFHEWEKALPGVREKYKRRIRRFSG